MPDCERSDGESFALLRRSIERDVEERFNRAKDAKRGCIKREANAWMLWFC